MTKRARKIEHLAVVAVVELRNFFCHFLEGNSCFFANIVGRKLKPMVYIVGSVEITAFADSFVCVF